MEELSISRTPKMEAGGLGFGRLSEIGSMKLVHYLLVQCSGG